MKFADDTAIVECSTKNDDCDHRQEIKQLEILVQGSLHQCQENKGDNHFISSKTLPPPMYIRGAAVEVVCSFMYRGTPLKTLTFSGTP